MSGSRLRIGMLAPISHPFPPPGYGPWEQVCHDLTEGLVQLGHEVTVFAPTGSTTSAALSETVPMSLAKASQAGVGHDSRVWEEYHIAAGIRRAIEGDVDLIHSHLHVHALGYAPLLPFPLVTTLHGAGWDSNHHLMLAAHRQQPFVSLSDAERAFMPDLRYVATVPNGIRIADYRPRGPVEERLVFLGRLAPEKAPDLAIETAELAGLPLVMAGLVEERHQDFFESAVKPRLHPGRVDYLGPVSREEARSLLGGSTALVMPLRWEEPFGLVVVESLAMGTPVVAWRRGAMPELLDEGVTGFLVEGPAAAAEAVGRVSTLDRSRCRREAEARFGHLTMAERYVTAYRRAIDHTRAARSSETEVVATRTPTSEKP